MSIFWNCFFPLTVPTSPPLCRIPASVTTGRPAKLSCHDNDGSPPPKYAWYKDGVLLPPDPSKIASFRNATYKINVDTGNLVSHKLLLSFFSVTVVSPLAFTIKDKLCLLLQEFSKTTKADSGQYYCEASNDAGPPQRCKGAKMEIRELSFMNPKKTCG